jgi:hypothetical protein
MLGVGWFGVAGVPPLGCDVPFGPLTEVNPGVGDCALTAVKPPPAFTGVNPVVLAGRDGSCGSCGIGGLRPSIEALRAFEA